MNIFAVDENPVIAAQALPDKLVIKMSTESLQMLTPWLFNTYGTRVEKPNSEGQFALLEEVKSYYGVKGFAHHPCSKWLYEDLSNVQWLLEHALELCEEYSRRYEGKNHGSLFALNQVRNHVSDHFVDVASENHTPFVQAMPEDYKNPRDAVSAYRNYLMGAKGYAEWRYCSPPSWWNAEKHRPIREKYLEEKYQKKLLRQHAKHSSTERSLQT